MAFPVRTVARPAALHGQSNGRLAPGVLKATPGQAKGPVVELVEPAARAWRALTAAAKKAGHTLKISGPSSAYRTYAMQEIIFRQRYTTTPNGSAGRWWNMRYWYKRPGVAAAAIPGTSNHGWGLAADVGEERDGDSGTESMDKATLKWLVANEERFGFSHEIQSEPWHIRYFTGDRIPAAVLAYERSLKPKPKPPLQEIIDMADAPSVLIKHSVTNSVYTTNGIQKNGPWTTSEQQQLLLIGATVGQANGVPWPVLGSTVDKLDTT